MPLLLAVPLAVPLAVCFCIQEAAESGAKLGEDGNPVFEAAAAGGARDKIVELAANRAKDEALGAAAALQDQRLRLRQRTGTLFTGDAPGAGI